QVVEHRLALSGRERVEVDGGGIALPAAPGGTLLKQLRAGGGDDHDRSLRPVRYVIDEVQEPVIGPLDVVQDQDEWIAGGEAFQEATPGLEQLLADLLEKRQY